MSSLEHPPPAERRALGSPLWLQVLVEHSSLAKGQVLETHLGLPLEEHSPLAKQQASETHLWLQVLVELPLEVFESAGSEH